MKTQPKVFSIVGHSGSGKTTLVEKLIRELTARGIKVATIKHAHHQLQFDTPGKDSHRYKAAGATMSMLVSGDQLQLVADVPESKAPEALAQRFLGEVEIVLAEGFSLEGGAKIEVLRRACGKSPRCAIEDELITVVTDMEDIYPSLPHFGLEDISDIVQFMLEHK